MDFFGWRGRNARPEGLWRERIVMRLAEPEDHLAIHRLAQLADHPTPPLPLLLVEADGALLAAVSTLDGTAIADPYVPTADLVALTRVRVGQLGASVSEAA
jgi:hypothetical protein